jgi:hypothetical protein
MLAKSGNHTEVQQLDAACPMQREEDGTGCSHQRSGFEVLQVCDV